MAGHVAAHDLPPAHDRNGWAHLREEVFKGQVRRDPHPNPNIEIFESFNPESQQNEWIWIRLTDTKRDLTEAKYLPKPNPLVLTLIDIGRRRILPGFES